MSNRNKRENENYSPPPPAAKKESEEIAKRIVTYRSANRESNKITKPHLEEVRPVFLKLMDEVKFCSRGCVFGMFEYLFKSEEGASAVTMVTMENDK